MAYSIPDIKITDKDEIVKLIENYLQSGNSIADINGLLHDLAPDTHRHAAFARDIANKMKATGKYDIDKKPILHGDFTYLVYPLPVPEKNWAERNPFWDKVRTGFITFLFSIGAAILLYYILPPRPSQDSNQQNQHLIRLSDSLNILDKKITVLEDTLAKHKR